MSSPGSSSGWRLQVDPIVAGVVLGVFASTLGWTVKTVISNTMRLAKIENQLFDNVIKKLELVDKKLDRLSEKLASSIPVDWSR